MDVYDNAANGIREMLSESCKGIADQDMLIKTLSGEALTVFGPVTIFKDFIRFQDSAYAGTKYGRTINVRFDAISTITHK